MIRSYFPTVKGNIVLIKLFLSILSISTFAVILIAISIFYLFQNKTIEDLNVADNLALTNIQTLVHNSIDTTEKTIIGTYQNPAVKKLIYENNTEWNDTMIATVNNTLSTLSTYSFINSLYLFGEGNILFKASNSGIPEEEEGRITRMLRTETPGKPIPWTFKRMSGEALHIISIYIGERSTGSQGYDSAVMGNINMDMIHQAIFPAALSKGQEIYVVDKNGTVLLHNDMDHFNADVSQKPYITKMMKDTKDSGHFTTTVNDRKYNFGYIRSREGDYYVVHMMEYELSVQKLTGARNTILLISFLVLLLVLLTSFYIAYRIYYPIHTIFNRIRGLFGDIPQVSSNRNELQAMSNATAKIIERMNSYDRHVENKAAMEMFNLSRTGMKGEEIEDILRRMNILAQMGTGTPHAVIVLRIGNYRQFEENNTIQAIDFQLHSIGNIVSEYIQSCASCHVYAIDTEHAVLLVTEARFGEIDLNALLEDASQAVYNILGLDITIGVSPITRQSTDLPALYKEAYRLTNYRLLFGKRTVINARKANKEITNESLSHIYMTVTEALKRTSLPDYLEALNRLFAACSLLRYETIISLLSQLAVDIAKIPQAIGIKGAADNNPDYYELYVKFEKFEDFSAFTDAFTVLYEEISTVLANLNNTNMRDIASKAIDYIASNYHNQDLTANLMAEKLNITPSYFSKIFKECSRTTFPDYVASLRLEKARELLLQDYNQEIVDISAKVGYTNASYFTSAFKKKYGITPSKYRVNVLYDREINSN
ncbi:helix-turn-helix domain-containing protein [Paenibacillus sp. N3.4]|uniref:helix-turn-helix domain-containing protein n=1 Tax=Paenibacillus sp. N3.4 TaxID=2603222 RepID=UPI0011C92759|nr:helix-turn-helix domain-containing protein [Paenibacillus sp. N3.4]TXK72346.1 AraC family transcriptional regulator [Paenibacillus sp. N3.4]